MQPCNYVQNVHAMLYILGLQLGGADRILDLTEVRKGDSGNVFI